MRKKTSVIEVEKLAPQVVAQPAPINLDAIISAQDRRMEKIYADLEKQLGVMSDAQMQAIKKVIDANTPKPRTIKVTVESVDNLRNPVTKHYTLKIE